MDPAQSAEVGGKGKRLQTKRSLFRGASVLQDNEEMMKNEIKRKRKRKADVIVDRFDKKKFVWNAEDEIVILSTLAKCMEKGNPLPKNPLLYNQVKNLLNNDYSENQLRSKLKRLKKKFKDNLEKDKDSSSPHEMSVFLLSKTIWGNEKKKETAVKGNRNESRNKNIAIKSENEEEKDEEEKEKEKDGDDEIEPNTAAHESNGVREDILLNVLKKELNGGEVKVFELIKNAVKENMDNLKEFYKNMLRENDETMSKHKDELLASNQHMLNRNSGDRS